MAEKLHFSLVSPERELFSGTVDQVDAPGSEGMFGVLPNHAPFMTTLKAGPVTIFGGDDTTRLFVRGGFADVTPDGLTILAETALDLSEVSADEVSKDLEAAKQELAAASEQGDIQRAQDNVFYLEALMTAVAS